MANNGHIKVYRTLMDKGYYTDSEYVHLWIHLLMKATYREKEYLFNGKIENLKPGQFITGRNSLVKETHINRSKVERILKVFENEHQIEQQSNNKFRIITILNWSEYQTSEQQNGQQVSSQRAASEQPVSTNKKEKKEKKEDIFRQPSLEEVKKYCLERQNGVIAEKWYAHYESNGWMVGKNKMKNWQAAIRTWEEHSTGSPVRNYLP